MKRFVIRRLVTLLCTAGLLGISTHAMAAAFQLWEQDGASIGNYHAGYAAEANDASIAWYNPAGITRFKNQQVVLGLVGILTDFTYKGNVGITELSPYIVPTLIPPIATLPTTVTFNSVTAQGGSLSLVPNLHYVAPIDDHLGFGFSVTAPFGLKTSYGSSTSLRYAATLTSISVIDISPSIGFKVTDKASVGFGFDIQKASAEFNSVAGFIDPTLDFEGEPKTVLTEFDTTSTNKATDTGYGYHLGALYEFDSCTRAGISYHSQVVHHFSGSSKFIGPLADEFNNGPLETSRATTNIKLPAYTALSFFHKVNPSLSVMATAIYTQWDVFKNLTLNQVAGLVAAPTIFPNISTIEASGNLQVTIPQNYRNTWNLALGADYYPIDSVILRAGVGYDQTPVKDNLRNVQLPDNNRYVVALGGHFQATKTVGLDVGWMHIFIQTANITPPPQVNGGETVSTNGQVHGGADVFSGQVTWDIV